MPNVIFPVHKYLTSFYARWNMAQRSIHCGKGQSGQERYKKCVQYDFKSTVAQIINLKDY